MRPFPSLTWSELNFQVIGLALSKRAFTLSQVDRQTGRLYLDIIKWREREGERKKVKFGTKKTSRVSIDPVFELTLGGQNQHSSRPST